MSLLSIFTNEPPVQLVNLSDPERSELGVNYHFDAIAKYNLEQSSVYSSYPIEYGADIQDHAYINPKKVTIYGYTGSRELRFSVNQLPALGASAVIGNVNNPALSTAAGVAGDVFVNSSFLGGDSQTRPASTLDFLTRLQEKFITFTLQTNLIQIPFMKVDKINTEVNTENETGLEFIVELSQQRYVGETFADNNIENLPGNDPAKTQAAPIIERGRVAVA